MPKAHGQPKPIEAHMESSKSEEREETDSPPVPQENEHKPEAAANAEMFQSDDWWNPSPPASDLGEPVTDAPAEDIIPSKEIGANPRRRLRLKTSFQQRSQGWLTFIFAGTRVCSR